MVKEGEDVENVEEVEQEEGWKAKSIGIPPIGTVLAQKIMYFLKGLAGPRMITPTQALANPLFLIVCISLLGREVTMPSSVLSWVL